MSRKMEITTCSLSVPGDRAGMMVFTWCVSAGEIRQSMARAGSEHGSAAEEGLMMEPW